MSNYKSLTRQQKECLSAHYLKADDWVLVEEMDFYLKIQNKENGKIRFVDKFRREKRR